MSRGNPEIARKMEAWWRTHGSRHDDPAWSAYLADFSSLMSLKTDEMLSRHDNGGLFGMSKAGGCTRAASLKLLGEAGEPLTGASLVTFFIGHAVEVLAIATLRAVGYQVATHGADGKQIAVSIPPIMHSTHDGIVTMEDGRDAVLSVKSMSYKMSGSRWNGGKQTWTRFGWTALSVAGVRAEQPGYWAQAQAEMHGSELSQTLFVAVAKDMVKKMEGDPILVENGSLTFYAEIIPYDAEWCATQLIDTWERQKTYVDEGNAGPALVISRLPGNQFVPIAPGQPEENKRRVFPLDASGKTTGYDICSYCDMHEPCSKKYSK